MTAIRRRMCCAVLAAAAGAAVSRSALAQEDKGVTVGVPWTGDAGITETVAQIMARDRPSQRRPESPEHEVPRNKVPDPNSPQVPCWPWTGALPVAGNGVLDNPQTIGLTFQGAQYADDFYAVPDTVGAVGPTQIMACPNGRIRVFDKTGAVGSLNTSSDVFFNSVRAGAPTVDPQVRYDATSQRWFITTITDAMPNRVCLAVSSGPTITNSSSFTFFQFQQDLVGPTPNPDTGGFADYDSLGVDANAAYIGVNMYNPGFSGATAFVVRKSSVTGGGPIVVTAFRQILGPAGDGPFAPRGVSNDDPASTEGYFIGPSFQFFGRLLIRRVGTPGAVPTLSSNLSITVPTTSFPLNTPAQGSTHPLDALLDHCFDATIHKNRVTGLTSLWTAQNIQVNNQGVASTVGGRNGSRWYEIQGLTGTPALRQAGTLFDPASTNPRYYWIPTIAMSGQGHAALGCSFAGTQDRAGAATAGRLNSDALGAIQTPSVIVAGAADYNNIFGLQDDTYRWGDYSRTMVDPVDDQTIWTVQEYCNATDSWGIRVAKLLAPAPATPVSCSPTSVPQGAANFNVQVTGLSSNGSGFFDTAGLPGQSRLQASISGTGVTVDSVSFTSPTVITMSVTVNAGAATGQRTLTITNPDGQSASSAPGVINVGGGGVNDNCANFTIITPGVRPFSTTGASTDGPLETNCNIPDGQINQDIWYFYNADCTGRATLSICNANYDSRIAIYEGVCPTAPNTAIACNDNFCGQASQVSWDAVLHHSYTIRIGGAGTATGTGTITLTCNPCYPNCDSSTTPPILNIADFSCFINKFSAGDTYANCDSSTTAPVLNVLDFSCFLNRFIAGCN